VDLVFKCRMLYLSGKDEASNPSGMTVVCVCMRNMYVSC